jgi:acetyl esterase/lipase
MFVLSKSSLKKLISIPVMKSLKVFFACLLLFPLAIKAQEIINLYPDIIPNSKQSNKVESANANSSIIRGVTKPTLELYLPEKEKATGAAVIICPGGSYGVLVYQGEGIRTAKEFQKNGIAAFVLKYRLPDDTTMIDKKIGPLQDVQRAVKLVRENAPKWAIDANKIGLMGFSAGGHLASTGVTHFKKAVIENSNNTNLRPDFAILVYPVISMKDSLTHADSRRNLLGRNLSKEIINEFSNEMHVDANTPPTYITHASDDNVVDVDNSILFYEQLRRNKVPAELHIYQKGGHGFVFQPQNDNWMMPLFRWMKNSKWINN